MSDNKVTSNVADDCGTACERTRGERVYRPDVDIVEFENELVLSADMPGLSAESIDVKCENGLLTISGQVASRERPGLRPHLREYGVGDFQRQFRVSEQVDTAGVTANYRDGVLTLRLPKAEAAKPRRIAVTAE